MTRMRNEEIARAFAHRDYGHRNSTGSYWTDEQDGYGLLYSYRAIIAMRTPTGEVVHFEDWYGFSVTTSAHITLFSRALLDTQVLYRVADGRPRSLDEAIALAETTDTPAESTSEAGA